MTRKRRRLIGELEKARTSRVLIYATGDRKGLETQIGSDVCDFFTRHLDAIGDVPKLTLFLHTRGGDALAAWRIANLLRQFCDHLEVIVPSNAHSAGTLICLAANKIVMTKQASLGPIDPSVNTPLNPSIPGAPPTVKAPVSVEDINGFIEFAGSVSKEPEHLAAAFERLANAVNPLVLGNAYRARGQIRMLARKLMAKQYSDEKHVGKILKFLCSESGSHDYTINRREAVEELGLPVDKPDDQLYKMIKALYDDIAGELELANPYDPNVLLGAAPTQRYSFRRALIESIPGGSQIFMSEGSLTRVMVQGPQGPQNGISDDRTFEGWRLFNVRTR